MTRPAHVFAGMDDSLVLEELRELRNEDGETIAVLHGHKWEIRPYAPRPPRKPEPAGPVWWIRRKLGRMLLG